MDQTKAPFWKQTVFLLLQCQGVFWLVVVSYFLEAFNICMYLFNGVECETDFQIFPSSWKEPLSDVQARAGLESCVVDIVFKGYVVH